MIRTCRTALAAPSSFKCGKIITNVLSPLISICVYMYFIQFDSVRGSEREGQIKRETETEKGRARDRKIQGERQRVKRKKDRRWKRR